MVPGYIPIRAVDNDVRHSNRAESATLGTFGPWLRGTRWRAFSFAFRRSSISVAQIGKKPSDFCPVFPCHKKSAALSSKWPTYLLMCRRTNQLRSMRHKGRQCNCAFWLSLRCCKVLSQTDGRVRSMHHSIFASNVIPASRQASFSSTRAVKYNGFSQQ